MTDLLPPQLDLVDGTWQEPGNERAEHIEHATTGAAVQAQRATTPDALESVLASATAAHAGAAWSARGADERADVLEAIGAALEPEVSTIAALESVTTGATIGTTSMLGFIVHGAFGLAAAQLRAGVLSTSFEGPAGTAVEVDRLPWGPALMLCPWNAPAPMAAHKIASALAAGCPVVVKPPERAPHGTAAMVRVIADVMADAGLPAGLVQLAHGGPDEATTLMTDDRVRAVSFTGGIVGGRAVAHACAEGLKPAQLELGGHSPLVVMPDADTAHVVEAAVALLTTLNGQWCRALGRLLVPAERHDELVAAIADALGSVVVGDPLDPTTTMGPIVHSSHLVALAARVDELGAGGDVIAPTPLPDRPGNWMSPTLVTGVDPSATRSEMFGPVAAVHPYADLAEALALANGTDYGLEAYVVGTDTDEAMAFARRVRAGGVKVNGASPISLHLMAPRPAFGISGLHEEGTVETIHFFGGSRVVGIEGSLGQTGSA